MPRGSKAKNGKAKDKGQQDVPVGERAAGPELTEQAEAERRAAKSEAIAKAASEISAVEVEIASKRAIINKKKEALKKEFGVGKRAFAAAYALYKMDDETARTSIIADTLECMRALDLLDPTAPLFSKAGIALPKESAAEVSASATVEGRAAHGRGARFDACPYPEKSVNRDAWERGWLAEQTAWSEKEAAEKGEAPPPAAQPAQQQPAAH